MPEEGDLERAMRRLPTRRFLAREAAQAAHEESAYFRAPDGTPPDELQEGSYCKRGSRWWVRLPSGALSRLDERWAVDEHEDRTITVSPSLFDSPDGWHGFLERGQWRPAREVE